MTDQDTVVTEDRRISVLLHVQRDLRIVGTRSRLQQRFDLGRTPRVRRDGDGRDTDLRPSGTVESGDSYVVSHTGVRHSNGGGHLNQRSGDRRFYPVANNRRPDADDAREVE